MNRISENLKKALVLTGMNQKKLATTAGLNETAVRDILKGRSKDPRIGTILKLAEALKTDPWALIADPKSPWDLTAQSNLPTTVLYPSPGATCPPLTRPAEGMSTEKVQEGVERATPPENTDVCHRLKEIRKEAGLTQKRLANLCGMSLVMLQYIENGQRQLTPKWMPVIASVLKVEPWMLIADRRAMETYRLGKVGQDDDSGKEKLPRKIKTTAAQNRLREIRLELGLSLEALGALVGTSAQQIFKLETGQRKISLEWMRRIASALKIEPWMLIADPKAIFDPREREVISRYHALPDHLREIDPDPAVFEGLIVQVGGPWGWTRRPKYRDVFARAARLEEPQTRLFVFEAHGHRAGYSLTHALACPPEGLEGCGDVTEIENFGLFPEQTGRGLGGPFLKALFAQLFKTPETGAVYLTTRSTNHARVVPFYEKAGMKILRQEIKADDLPPPNMDTWCP